MMEYLPGGDVMVSLLPMTVHYDCNRWFASGTVFLGSGLSAQQACISKRTRLITGLLLCADAAHAQGHPEL